MSFRVPVRTLAGVAAFALFCSVPMASVTACGGSENEGAPSPTGDAGSDAPLAEPPPPVPYAYRCTNRPTEDACLPTVRAYCRRLFACDAWKGAYSQGDETLCVNNLTANCVARHDINAKAADGALLAAGAKTLDSLTCTEIVDLNYRIFFGVSQPGEPCDADGVCLRSSCSAIKDNVQKGTCQVGIFPKDGEPCLLGTHCDYGHYCAIRGGDCRKASGEGERCNTELNDAACGEGLFCERPVANQDGHCQRWLEPGAACDPAQARCVGGALCDAGTRTCTLIAAPIRKTLGQVCNPLDDSPVPRPGKDTANRCSLGEWCEPIDGVPGKCRPLNNEGEPCDLEGPPRCLGQMSCSSVSGEPKCQTDVCNVVVDQP